ncbi:hypothetical protein N9W41_01050 [bacterium]|nr:hypothetical protein [bacterium]
MIKLVVGHRGVGKSAFLERLSSYNLSDSTEFVDLDSYIEKKEKLKIPDIFETLGESVFREKEWAAFEELYKNKQEEDLWISLGAGFPVEKLGDYKAEIIWLKRASDHAGRIFLNRPRLNSKVSPLEEFKERFDERETKFKKHAHKFFMLPEGNFDLDTIEKKYLGLESSDNSQLNVALTLENSQMINNISYYQSLGIKFFELRDDLLTKDQITQALKALPPENLIYSHRKGADLLSGPGCVKYTDWALELGEPVGDKINLLSLHEKENAYQRFEKYDNKKYIFKLAIPINSFEELEEMYKWWLENPTRRLIFPISTEGKWRWFRQIIASKQLFNFYKSDDTIIADQPYLYQSFGSHLEKGFAAVVGKPTDLSWTPQFHRRFFFDKQMSVVNINLSEEELSVKSLNFLKSLGLKFCAVTSPLKIKAFDLSTQKSELSKELESTNSLYFKENEIVGDNTDYQGFLDLVKCYENSKGIVVWGGGGTNAMVKKALPQASLYSSREAKPRPDEQSVENPEVIIWSVGNQKKNNFPPANWKPKVIIDLNYFENSPGIEYAQITKAKYLNGIAMFVSQGNKQQEKFKEFSG